MRLPCSAQRQRAFAFETQQCGHSRWAPSSTTICWHSSLSPPSPAHQHQDILNRATALTQQVLHARKKMHSHSTLASRLTFPEPIPTSRSLRHSLSFNSSSSRALIQSAVSFPTSPLRAELISFALSRCSRRRAFSSARVSHLDKGGQQ